MDKRELVFKNILYEIINCHHKNFLERKRLSHFNPIITKTWHHKFNLEKLPEIPCLTLIQNNKDNMGNNVNLSTVGDYIKSIDIKGQLVNEAFEKLKQEKLNKKQNNNDDSKENNISNDGVSILSKFISSDLIEKVIAYYI